jgi:hypothetical protein
MVMVSRFALVIAAVAGLLVALAYDEIPRWASSPRRRLLLRAAVVLPLISTDPAADPRAAASRHRPTSSSPARGARMSRPTAR